MAGPTLRSLARTLGVSRTTISEALRGSPRVHPDTAARIRTAAEAAGYQHNPLAGAIMSELRRSRSELFRGLLALVDLDEPDRPTYSTRFHDELARGAQERAAELGFKVERFVAGVRALPQHRLDHILQSRGIRGVMLLPAWRQPDLLQLDWKRYAGVYFDYHIERPALHCICCDHFRSMLTALARLHALGYRRPGVMLPRQHDERLQHRWEGAFLAYQSRHDDIERVPPLIIDQPNQDEFTDWFREYQPDVVLTHITAAMDWMRAAGAKIPRTHGFFCLNLIHADTPCAGLDLAPHRIGAMGAEIAIAQLHRNELGVPATRTLTTLPSTWVDGPTLRAQSSARKKSATPADLIPASL